MNNIFDQKYLIINKRYNIPTGLEKKVVEFSDKCYDTNKYCYGKRSQRNEESAKKQIQSGKYLEVASQEYFDKMEGYVVDGRVDFSIYPYESKSYDSDIYVKSNDVNSKRYGLSCKSSYSERGNADLYGIDDKKIGYVPRQHSYIYQVGDEVKHDFYCFGNVDFNNMKVTLFAIVKGSIVEKMFVNPFLKRFWASQNKGDKISKGKYAIMAETCSNQFGFPCGIMELESRIKHEA